MSKSSNQIVKEVQEQKVKNFTSDYYQLCERYGLQIVQSPLSIADYIKPEPQKDETPKVAS